MIDYNAYRRKIACLKDTENWEEKAAAVMAQLHMEILEQFIRLANGFSPVETPALVAALDRYKSMLLDTTEERRKDIQEVADEINRCTTVTFACVKERRGLYAD